MFIRWLIRKDLPSVTQFGLQSEDEIISLCRKRNMIGMVYEDEDIHGYIIYELHKGFLVIHTIYGDSKEVYSALIERLQSRIEEQRRRYIEIDVEEDNLTLQLVLKEHGFLARAAGGIYRFQYYQKNRIAQYLEML